MSWKSGPLKLNPRMKSILAGPYLKRTVDQLKV